MTSQIFANIYLNEFDRYIRQQIRPLAYVRYGDDFVIFVDSERQAQIIQHKASTWLIEQLKLTLHPKNNVMFRARAGAHFLGHWIYPGFQTTIDAAMKRKIEQRISQKNVASYKAMKINAKELHRLSWTISGQLDG